MNKAISYTIQTCFSLKDSAQKKRLSLKRIKPLDHSNFEQDYPTVSNPLRTRILECLQSIFISVKQTVTIDSEKKFVHHSLSFFTVIFC